jgi:streptogramin lyase
MLWTSGANNQIDVLLVDGATGEVDDMVSIPEVPPDFFGIYGGASDGEGNFWGSQLGIGYLIRVDRDDMTYEYWPMAGGGYGMTVDQDGYVWTCAYEASRFDPESETWQVAQVSGSGGCMADTEGRLWMSGGSNDVVAIDRETMQVLTNVPLGDYVHGISIDFYGYVWGVSMNVSAYRIDPETEEVESYDGLNYPYTYSDMTGYALSNAGTVTN